MMGYYLHIVLSILSFTTVALGEVIESEEIIPVRLNVRNIDRLWTTLGHNAEKLSFLLNAFGNKLTIHLTPNSNFVAPTLNIQRVNSKHLSALLNGTRPEDIFEGEQETLESGQDFRDCFYSGFVNNNQESVVAVSLCHGIQGSFVANGDEYFIQPKNLRGDSSLGMSFSQVHIIKRRVFPITRDRDQTAQDLSGAFLSPVSSSQQPMSRGDVDDKPLQRQKRFVSSARYIETLVVADSTMTSFYGDEIKHYLLTVMAMAAQVYNHPSLKNAVSLVVVRMLLVEEEEKGPSVSRNGGLALRNFCTWQQLFNPSSQRHPEHYDTAILFTRLDICGNLCDTLGVADVGTMCDPKRSCSVIEDNGLQAAFTVAHELGHVLSMPHDDSKNCERWFGHMDGHHMMAPKFVHLNRTLPWSPCSAQYVTEFFDNGHGDCLLDPPEQMLPLPADPPGRVYSLERQCQQVFGEEFVHCADAQVVCRQLWCRQEGQLQCATRNGSLPWADGTPCEQEGRCLRGVCVNGTDSEGLEEPVDGGWGPWGPWGPCSRTCGGGVEFSRRECTDPEPRNGGAYCMGQRVKYQSCNTQVCLQSSGKSFREEQCERYNTNRYLDINGNIKQWIPKYAGVFPRDRCKLFCRAKGTNEYKVFEPKVIDGTPCGPDTTSVCVQGQCVKAGCDLVIGSSLRLDKCGVCGGDGSLCRKISGSMNRAVYGYNDVVTIPKGATNIDIKQRSPRDMRHDGNYLALRQGDGHYILNGNLSISMVEQYLSVPGATLRYSGSSTSLERILSFQKLQQPITVQVLATTAGDETLPRIKYTFFLPRDVPFARPSTMERMSPHALLPLGGDEWVLGEWSECSKTCGSGWSRRSVECKDMSGSPSFFCDPDLRPSDIRPCADLPCPVWQMGPWSACSRTCGPGQRRRSVLCLDYTGKAVEAERCSPDKRPDVVSGECFYQDC